MKNVQIPQELFIKLIDFHLFDKIETCEEIKKGLEEKMDRIVKHDIYSRSKTAPTKEERENARREYLDQVGMHPDFRW